jgi:hypothetical protein
MQALPERRKKLLRQQQQKRNKFGRKMKRRRAKSFFPPKQPSRAIKFFIRLWKIEAENGIRGEFTSETSIYTARNQLSGHLSKSMKLMFRQNGFSTS